MILKFLPHIVTYWQVKSYLLHSVNLLFQTVFYFHDRTESSLTEQVQTLKLLFESPVMQYHLLLLTKLLSLNGVLALNFEDLLFF